MLAVDSVALGRATKLLLWNPKEPAHSIVATRSGWMR